ncbi:hypothetical protein ACFQ0X_43725 [Streptomyces rectiviolaceus]|uniref:Uncharacterized protein n=1 Tax=Streptomyces rectiviolaceus TaxID=332591 RepID=A0ABP6NMG0_9ACTN
MYLLYLALGLVVTGILYALTAAKRNELIEQRQQANAPKSTCCHHHCCCTTRT